MVKHTLSAVQIDRSIDRPGTADEHRRLRFTFPALTRLTCISRALPSRMRQVFQSRDELRLYYTFDFLCGCNLLRCGFASHSMLLSCNVGYTRHLSAEEAATRDPGLNYTASIPKFQSLNGLWCNLPIFQRNWHQSLINSAFIEKVWARYFLLYPSSIWNIHTRPAEAFSTILRLASWVSTTGLCMLCNPIKKVGA